MTIIANSVSKSDATITANVPKSDATIIANNVPKSPALKWANKYQKKNSKGETPLHVACKKVFSDLLIN